MNFSGFLIGIGWAIIGAYGVLHYHYDCSHTTANGFRSLAVGVALGAFLGPITWIIEQSMTPKRGSGA